MDRAEWERVGRLTNECAGSGYVDSDSGVVVWHEEYIALLNAYECEVSELEAENKQLRKQHNADCEWISVEDELPELMIPDDYSGGPLNAGFVCAVVDKELQIGLALYSEQDSFDLNSPANWYFITIEPDFDVRSITHWRRITPPKEEA